MTAINPSPILPNELWLRIFEHAYGICFLRRHVVAHLQQMHLMSCSQSDTKNGIIYTSHAYDYNVRGTAPFDQQERTYYFALLQGCRTPSRNIIERDWLSQPPMKLQTFTNFCSDMRGPAFRGRQHLVLELFSQADFFHPSFDISGLDWLQRWRLATRAELRPTPADRIYLEELDEQIHECLANAWIAILSRVTSPDEVRSPDDLHLPDGVQWIKVIARAPDAPGMMAGLPVFDNDELLTIAQELQKLTVDGKVEYGGSIVVSIFDVWQLCEEVASWKATCSSLDVRHSAHAIRRAFRM